MQSAPVAHVYLSNATLVNDDFARSQSINQMVTQLSGSCFRTTIVVMSNPAKRISVTLELCGSEPNRVMFVPHMAAVLEPADNQDLLSVTIREPNEKLSSYLILN